VCVVVCLCLMFVSCNNCVRWRSISLPIERKHKTFSWLIFFCCCCFVYAFNNQVCFSVIIIHSDSCWAVIGPPNIKLCRNFFQLCCVMSHKGLWAILLIKLSIRMLTVICCRLGVNINLPSEISTWFATTQCMFATFACMYVKPDFWVHPVYHMVCVLGVKS